MSNDKLSRGLLAVMALPAIMQGFMHAPAATLMQGIYAKHAGLPLTALAAAVLITRLFDAVTDPLIGYLSDRAHARTGSRKQWIFAGTFVTAVGLWFLFRPPQNVTITYFTAWFMVAYLGWTMTEIPYRAWSVELTRDYVQRTRIQVWIGLGTMVGLLVFYLTPYIAKAFGMTDTTEFDLRALAFAAIIIVVLMPLLNLLALARVPNGVVSAAHDTAKGRDVWHSIIRNGPLMRLTLAFIVVSITSGMSQGVMYLYVDTYLGLSEQFGALSAVAVLLTLGGIPAWGWLCSRYERHRVWAIAILTMGVSYGAIGFAPPGEASLWLVAPLYSIAVFCLTAALVAAPAMLGDVADHGRLEFGQDRAGVYMSFHSLISKSVIGLGTAIGLAAIGWFGFNATASTQTASGAFGIRFVAVWLPSVGFLTAALVLWHFPIGRARHAQIVAELKARDVAPAAAPVPVGSA